MDLQIIVDGHPLLLECQPGDIEMSTNLQGSDTLSWTPGDITARRYRGAELVSVTFGGVPVWAGSLTEPDPSQDQLSAQGAWRDGIGYAALDGSGNSNAVPNTAIDQAIVRGLDWTRPASISASSAGITDPPLMLNQLLDNYASANTVQWGVDPYRQVFTRSIPTTPIYQTFPLAGGLGYALDNYASTLVGRYLDSGTSTNKTVSRTDTTAETLHGHMEALVDITQMGSMTSTAAGNILTSMLALGRAIPQWTTGIEFAYGEILNMGGVPVALETVAAGQLLRVHGGFELAQRLNGLMYIDVQIGRTQLAEDTLTVSPAELAMSNLSDVLASVITKRSAA